MFSSNVAFKELFCFIRRLIYSYWEWNECWNVKNLKMFGLKIITNRSNFHQLEVVGRGSKTQLQMGGFF